MEDPMMVYRGDDLVDLPPGFRFHPTDEEIITHYLTEKVKNSSFSASAIGEVDLNKCEPWDLPKRAKMGEKEWYFFCQRDRKYPTGMRTNRATEAGYWKATGKDKEIFRGKNCLVGMKKTLVFYRGRAPKGEKTNWVMHEFRLEGKFNYYTLAKAAKDEWVVCRVFHKSGGIKKAPIHELARSDSFGDDYLDYNTSLPPLMEPTYSNKPGSSSFSDGETSSDFKGITSSKSFDGYQYFRNSTALVNSNFQLPSTSYQTPLISSNLHQPQLQVTNPLFTFQTPPNMPVYNFQTSMFGGNQQSILRELSARDEAFGMHMDKQRKLEQFSSNHSMVSLSQDTGLSTDVNTAPEISSVASKQEMGSICKVFGEIEGPSVPISDLESFWEY